MRKTMLAVAIVVGVLGVAAVGPAVAGDPVGLWLTKDKDAKVKVADCGGVVCGTVVWLRDPIDPATGKPVTDKKNAEASKRNRPLMGVEVVIGMKPSGTPDKWTGHIYNSDDGKTYRGSIELQDPTNLKVEGCVLGFCESETWTRTD